MRRSVGGSLAAFVSLVTALLLFVATAEAQVAISACSWNVRRLGHGADRDFGVIAKQIESICDVAALQEMMSTDGGGAPGLDQLRAALGDGWEVVYEPHPVDSDTRSGNREGATFVFRRTLATPCPGWTGVVFTAVVGFKRPPGFLCLEIRDRDGNAIGEVILGDYHARWARGRRRPIEAEFALLPAVIAEIRAREARSTIVIGADTNLRGAMRGRVMRLGGWRPETRIVEPGAGTTLRASGAITTNDYDAFIVDVPAGASVDAFVGARVVSPDPEDVSGARYVRNVSDHLPIGVVLDLVDTAVSTPLPDGVACAGNTMALLTLDEHRSPTVARRAAARRSAQDQVEERAAQPSSRGADGSSGAPSVGAPAAVSR